MKAKRRLISSWLLTSLLLPVICQAQPVVTNIAAGLYHSLFIMSDGSLWGMGENGGGQLGIGNFNSTNLPVKIITNNVVAVAGGGFHTLFVKSDGSLWAMGDNQYGELGDGTFNTNNLPEMIVASNVTAVAAGVYHSLFLKSDSSLWGMGYNHDGQLGDGSFGSSNQTNRPEYIATNVIAVAAGNYHSLFQKSDGSLWGMGYNAQGALGTGNNNSVYSPVEITNHVFGFAAGGNHSLFFNNDPNHPNLWAMGDNSEGEFGNGNNNNSSVPEPINITVGAFGLITRGSLAAGSDHTLYVAGDDNRLWAMGRGDYGQLGYSGSPAFLNVPVIGLLRYIGSLAAGAYHSMFLRYDGGLWLTGNNGGGELGDGTFNNVSRPNLVVPGNRVINGGFEMGDFSSWTFSSFGYDNTIVSNASSFNPHSGTYGAQFHKNTSGLAALTMSQTLSTQSNQVYLLSLWVNGVTNGGGLVDWNGQILVNESFNPGWTNLQFVVTATGPSTILEFVTAYETTALDDVSVVPLPPGYNHLTAQLLDGGDMRLSFTGLSPVLNDQAVSFGQLFQVQLYALDRTFNLATPSWVPQATNYSGLGGVLVFTNTPDPATNNFWRIRYVGAGSTF